MRFYPTSTERRQLIEFALLALILVLAGYLRLSNPDNPGWYSDEGTHLDIAQHALHGHTQYLAVSQSTLLFGRMPLLHWILAGALRLAGGTESVVVLRGLTGGLGTLTVLLLYAAVRRVGAGFALLAALMLAIYPQAVLYNRFGFSYNLVAPLAVLALWGAWRYLEDGRRAWLALAALAVGVGVLCDLASFSLLAPLVLVAPLRRRRDLLWSLPLAAVPFAFYVLAMLLAAPSAFLFDLEYTLTRVGGTSLAEQLDTLTHNYTVLLSQDFWSLAGLAGLAVMRPARLGRLALLMLTLPVAIIGRTIALYSLSAYYTIPFMPLVALGVAGLVWRGFPYILRIAEDGLNALASAWGFGRPRAALAVAAGLATLALVGAPLLVTLRLEIDGVLTRLGTAIDPFLLNPADARQASDYVNAFARDDDVIIASPGIAWRLRGRVADFQMVVAYTGQPTPHLPGDIPQDRFVFVPGIERARFVVIDNLWRNWGAVHVPGLDGIIRTVEAWPRVFEAGAISVYRNPALSP